MDPDPEPAKRGRTSSPFKMIILSIIFCSLYFFQPSQQHVIFNPPPNQENLNRDAAAKPLAKKNRKKKKSIYLSFDDGPNKGTRNVRRIVEKEEVPVTFFIIGEHVYGSKAQQAEYDSILTSRFCYVANHSYTHARAKGYDGFYAVPDSVVADFKRCADSLNLTAGIIRTPGRNIWRTDSLMITDIRKSAAAADSLFQEGFRILGWDTEWHYNKDGLMQDPCEMLEKIDSLMAYNKTRTPGHLVLLAHDQAFAGSADSAALHRFIREIRLNQEYELVTMDEYP